MWKSIALELSEGNLTEKQIPLLLADTGVSTSILLELFEEPVSNLFPNRAR
jgi:hypothetical protein